MTCGQPIYSSNIWFNYFTFPVHRLAEVNDKRLKVCSG